MEKKGQVVAKEANLAVDLEQGNVAVARSGVSSSDSSGSANQDEQQQQQELMSQAPPRMTTMQDSYYNRRVLGISMLILCVCGAACGLILSLGIPQANQDQEEHFLAFALDVTRRLENVWSDYQNAGLWVHQSSLRRPVANVLPDQTTIAATNATWMLQQHIAQQRRDINQIHAYLQSTGLDYPWIGLAPNVTHGWERGVYEGEGEVYYNQTAASVDPSLAFLATGYVGFRERTGPITQDKPFYFPLHYMAPPAPWFLDLDLYSPAVFSLQSTIQKAMDTWQPVLSDRMETFPGSNRYVVLLTHPGTQVPDDPTVTQPDAVAVVSVGIHALLYKLGQALNLDTAASVYLFDSTKTTTTTTTTRTTANDDPMKDDDDDDDDERALFWEESA